MSKVTKAYVLCANEKYFDIVSMCAKSIREFSKELIIVYLLNSDAKVDLENTLTLRWNCKLEDSDNLYTGGEGENFYVNRSNNSLFNIFAQRPAVLADALVKYAEVVVYVDSDSIATPNIDRVFEMYPINTPYPYLTEGIYEWLLFNGRGGAKDRNDLSTTLEHPVCELFGIDQYVRQRYRTSNFFIAGQKAIDFLEEWYWMCMNPKVQKDPPHYAPYQEETLANALLWKYNYQKGLPLTYINTTSERIDEVYTKVKFTGETYMLGEWYRVPTSKKNILLFHGEKRLDKMQEMLDKVKKYNTKDRQRLLIISPHLSTGGLPQYLLKKLEFLVKEYDVYLIEYTNLSDTYIVQKQVVKKMLGNKHYTLGDNKWETMHIINTVEPDIIHLEEIPEFFMDEQIAAQIYGNKQRDYFIVSTSHSSTTKPENLKFYPDKFIFASKWTEKMFKEALPKIPTDVWEYPIENFGRSLHEEVQKELGFDPEYKHVLMVGLFTRGKNQGEIFKLAKLVRNKKIKFHFIGNQASNFEEYWGPLMKDKPDSCIIWGERTDVAKFYQACDLLYFSSKFELNPLTIKEALSYDLPCIFRHLETYMDTYDNNPLVTYIDDDINKTKQILLEKLCIEI